MMSVLRELAKRSTCPRRSVGAIITDDKGIILGTGFNGVPRKYPHCTQEAQCPGFSQPSGQSDKCMAIHAEQNAIINCHDISRASIIYCTTLPCFTCMKMILNTTIQKIVYADSYPDQVGYRLAKDLGRTVLKFPEEIR